MKQPIDPCDTTPSLCELNHQKFNLCAVAAIAVVVSVLTFAKLSEAKIVYTPANVAIGDYNLDLDHDGVTDFTIQNSASGGQCSWFDYVNELPASGNGAVPFEDIGGRWAAALVLGAQIGDNQQFDGGLGRMAVFGLFRPPCQFAGSGPWFDVIDHYLGLNFQINGRIHYGWARLSVKLHQSRSGSHFIATLTGYAYETIPGKSIVAGAIPEVASPVDFDHGASVSNPIIDTPQSTALLVLTLGARAAPLCPRKESAVEHN